MPTTRLFTYTLPISNTPNGVLEIGNVLIQDFSDPSSPFVGQLGYEWFYGPDEDLAYIVSHVSGEKTRGKGTGLIKGTCVGWWKSKLHTESSFVSLTKMIADKYGKTITIGDGAGNYYPYNTSAGLSGYGAKLWLEDSETVPAHIPFWSSYTQPTAYRYYKWEITSAKTMPPNTNCVQASEFVFTIDGVTQSMSGVSVTNPSGSNSIGEGPGNLVDGSLALKALDLNFIANNGTNFIFDMGDTARAFNGYRWATANDEVSRDPSSWNLWGSNDQVDWLLLNGVTNFVATDSRNTWQSLFKYNNSVSLIDSILDSYLYRVGTQSLAVEDAGCVTSISNSIYNISQTATFFMVPNAYKSGTLYSQLPNSGNGDFTFTRETNATRTNRSGAIQIVSSGVPRLDYSLGGCANLLLEPQRTNLALYSDQVYANDPALLDGTTFKSNIYVSPDSTTNASEFAEEAGDQEHGVYQNIQMTASTRYTISCYVRKMGRRYFSISSDLTGSATYSFFDSQNLTVVRSGGYDCSIQDVNSNWFRIIASATASTTASRYVAIYSSLNDTATQFNGSTSVVQSYWGLQIEAGSYVTSYISTSEFAEEAVTRNADSATFNNVYTNGLIGPSGGTLLLEFRNPFTINDTSTTIRLGDLSNNLRISAGLAGYGFVVQKTISGTGTNIHFSFLTSMVKLIFRWNGTGVDVYINGSLIVSNSSFTTLIMDSLTLSGGTQTFIKQIALWNTPLTGTQCIFLTT